MGKHLLDPRRAAGQLHVTDRVMGHAQLDALPIFRSRGLKARRSGPVIPAVIRAGRTIRAPRPAACQPSQGFLHIELALIAVGVESGLVMAAQFDDPPVGSRCGIKHMLEFPPKHGSCRLRHAISGSRLHWYRGSRNNHGRDVPPHRGRGPRGCPTVPQPGRCRAYAATYRRWWSSRIKAPPHNRARRRFRLPVH